MKKHSTTAVCICHLGVTALSCDRFSGPQGCNCHLHSEDSPTIPLWDPPVPSSHSRCRGLPDGRQTAEPSAALSPTSTHTPVPYLDWQLQHLRGFRIKKPRAHGGAPLRNRLPELFQARPRPTTPRGPYLSLAPLTERLRSLPIWPSETHSPFSQALLPTNNCKSLFCVKYHRLLTADRLQLQLLGRAACPGPQPPLQVHPKVYPFL